MVVGGGKHSIYFAILTGNLFFILFFIGICPEVVPLCSGDIKMYSDLYLPDSHISN